MVQELRITIKRGIILMKIVIDLGATLQVSLTNLGDAGIRFTVMRLEEFDDWYIRCIWAGDNRLPKADGR
jgi:hypothetical protein